MADREQLIRRAFSSYADGDLEPFRELLGEEARWVGVPRGRSPEETPTCRGRSEIVALLARHYGNGRRFVVDELIEQGDRVAAGVTIASPEWSAPVKAFKVFTFRPGEDVVIRLNDCVDESYALQVLVA